MQNASNCKRIFDSNKYTRSGENSFYEFLNSYRSEALQVPFNNSASIKKLIFRPSYELFIESSMRNQILNICESINVFRLTGLTVSSTGFIGKVPWPGAVLQILNNAPHTPEKLRTNFEITD